MPHEAIPLGPEMARAAFISRLPLPPLFDAIGSISLRQLVAWCLGPKEPPLMHLTGLSILGGASAGARDVQQDEEALACAHYEYFGRPFSTLATLWPEQLPLLACMLRPEYAQRHGAEMARHVHSRVLHDVVVNDFAAVASSECRVPQTVAPPLPRAPNSGAALWAGAEPTLVVMVEPLCTQCTQCRTRPIPSHPMPSIPSISYLIPPHAIPSHPIPSRPIPSHLITSHPTFAWYPIP